MTADSDKEIARSRPRAAHEGMRYGQWMNFKAIKRIGNDRYTSLHVTAFEDIQTRASIIRDDFYANLLSAHQFDQ